MPTLYNVHIAVNYYIGDFTRKRLIVLQFHGFVSKLRKARQSCCISPFGQIAIFYRAKLYKDSFLSSCIFSKIKTMIKWVNAEWKQVAADVLILF